MHYGDGFTVIRDPLWNNIQLDKEALAVIDSEPFQRLRYVRQLGHAFVVYPSATHTRFEHAVGTYHLTRQALALLADRGELRRIAHDDITLIRFAGLLHDIGHYPFSHALEEAGFPSHEKLARNHLAHPAVRRALQTTGIDNVEERLHDLITGTSTSPLQGLISGSLDLDKIEYLTRDAHMCGVPYGAVDVDRLLHSLTIVVTESGDQAVGIREKGISALESLLFAKYQMYRNVYWHHAVRSATVMFKRAVQQAIVADHLCVDTIADSGDEELMQSLLSFSGNTLAQRLRNRDLYKRVVDLGGEDVPEGTGDWVSEDPGLVARVEDRVARDLNLPPGDLLIDFPAKAKMLDADMPLLRKDGTVQPLAGDPEAGQLGIQKIADELHARARRLRLFSATDLIIEPNAVVDLIARSKSDVEHALEEGEELLVVTGER